MDIPLELCLVIAVALILARKLRRFSLEFETKHEKS